MKTMGIRELKARMSEAIREVQEGETIQITNHGEAVALLVPVRRKPHQAEIQSALKSLDEIREEMARYITEPTDVARMIGDMRR